MRAKPDTDILCDERHKAPRLIPAVEEEYHALGPQIATDELVMVQFKKHMRKCSQPLSCLFKS